MIINSKSKFPKKLIITSAIIFILVASILIYIYVFYGNFFGWERSTSQGTARGNNSVDYDPATLEQQKAGTRIKDGSKSDTPPAPTSIPGSSKKNVQLTITAANQNGSTLQIRTLISAVVDTGECTLTLTKTGQPNITKTASVQAQSTTSTCQGFDVPISELAVGTWHVVIEYVNYTLTGSATQDIVIK